MIHVEYTADGREREQTQKEEKTDGNDRKREVVHISRDVQVEVNIALAGGHVNLEGYAPCRAGDHVAEKVQHMAPENVEIDARSLDAHIHGSGDEWLQQARRYISERPGMDVFDALELFRGWGCTNSRAIDRAEEKAMGGEVDTSPLAGVER